MRADDPGPFLRQQIEPLLIHRTVESDSTSPDIMVQKEEDFWNWDVNLLSAVRISGLTLTDWFPRVPGRFWSREAKARREMLQSRPTEDDPSLGEIYAPMVKSELVGFGGIGCVRLRPRKIDGDYCWLATATSSGICYCGIPLVIPETILCQSSVRWGESIDLVGRIRFLQDAGLDYVADAVHGNRPIIVFVEELTTFTRSHQLNDIVLTPVILCKPSKSDFPSDEFPQLSYTFVHCGSLSESNLRDATDWLQRHADKHHRTILTNFDEQLPYLSGAPLSYQRLVERIYDRTTLNFYAGSVMINRLDQFNFQEINMGHNISVKGDAIFNIDSTLNQVEQTLGNSKALDQSQKESLDFLIRWMASELNAIKTSHPTETEAIADAMKSAATEANKLPQQRDKNLLKVTADGLIAAAKTVADIAPPVLQTASAVAKFFSGL